MRSLWHVIKASGSLSKLKTAITLEIPGGKRELNETIQETAVRELFEETGAVKCTCKPLFNYCVESKGGAIMGAVILCGY